MNCKKVCWFFGTTEEIQNPSMCIREDCVFFDSCVDITKYVYYLRGKKYRKLKKWEVIKEGAMSKRSGEISQINENCVGKTPSEFSDKRDFFNPLF
jgi:hypothetical protein